MKIRHRNIATEQEIIIYYCPGCKHTHHVPPKRWNWNGDVNKPTLSPSVRHFYTHPTLNTEITVCHYHVRNGNIEYCDDCEHGLKGQIVPLPEINDDDLPSPE